MKNSIGENLRRIRMGKGITRIELAEMTKGKVSKNAIYYIEKGVTAPRDSTVMILAKALDVSVEELMGIKEMSINELVGRIIYRLDSIESKFDKLISRLDSIENKLDKLISDKEGEEDYERY